jgi:hypothetical protein
MATTRGEEEGGKRGKNAAEKENEGREQSQIQE